MIEIHTDGACLGNPGPGGWGAIVVEGDGEREFVGSDPDTTNNRMEISAVIEGLRNVPAFAEVTVTSDSTYVINTMTKNWKRNKNNDLWEDLDSEVAKRHVGWKWVKGHAGHEMNERADRLARGAAERIAGGGSNGRSLTHVDTAGKARMVDVGSKRATRRVAEARGSVMMKAETARLIASNAIAKGDVLATARIAGVMAAKQTSQLIPLCHPIPLDRVDVDLVVDEGRAAVDISATATTTAKTGVEMEAMTAVSVAALTVYDMCKSVDRSIRIEAIRLALKTGGKSGDLVLEE